MAHRTWAYRTSMWREGAQRWGSPPGLFAPSPAYAGRTDSPASPFPRYTGLRCRRVRDTEDPSAAHRHIRGCSRDSVKLLLGYGANPNVQEVNGRNAYHEAAEIKDREIIRVLAAYGGNALSRDSFAKTPFSLVANENIALINFVLGSDKNLSDSDGNNPLHIAVLCKVKADTMTGLIESGYDINQRNSKGLTPLNYAIIQKQNNLAKILIQNNADPFVADNNGDCAITLAFNSPEVQDVLDALLRKYATTTDFQGDTILHYAARSANEETLKHILTFGLNKNATNNNGETAYEVARRWNNQTAIKLLK